MGTAFALLVLLMVAVVLIKHLARLLEGVADRRAMARGTQTGSPDRDKALAAAISVAALRARSGTVAPDRDG